jgi:hypothetical protein
LRVYLGDLLTVHVGRDNFLVIRGGPSTTRDLLKVLRASLNIGLKHPDQLEDLLLRLVRLLLEVD